MKFSRIFRRRDVAEAPPARVEPPLATPRETRTARLDAVRRFRAARPDRLLSGFSAFHTPTPRQDLREDIRGIVSHARAASQNYAHAVSYEQLARDNVVGPDGIRLVPAVVHTREDGRDRDGNALAGTPDAMANDRISDAWAAWARKGAPTPCGRLSLWDVQRQVVTAIIREGGMMFRHHLGRGPFGYQVEPLPFDLLDIDLTRQAGENFIESGIEFDPDGRPVAAHLWTVPQNDIHRPRHNRRRRIPWGQLGYVADLYEVGAALGVPRSQAALRMMGLAEQFDESALVAADHGARSVTYFEQEAGTEVAAALSPEDAPESLEPGSSVMLPAGVRANSPDPKYPEAAVEPFMDHFTRSQAAALGVSAESLSSNLKGANYSSLHAGMLKERDTWRTLQRVVVEGFLEPVRAQWLPAAMMAGRVNLPMRRLAKFDAAEWRPRGWSAVDPQKQARADREGLEGGFVTVSEIAARKGRTVEEIARERARDRAAFAAEGLGDPYAAPAATAAALNPQEGPENDD